MPPPKGRGTDDDLDWFTISYKTIYGGVALLVAVAAGALYYFYFRSGSPPPPVTQSPAPAPTTAHFTQIEGSVKVKTVGTFEWVSADKSMLLKKSDLVRTGSGATAEITFFDGTTVRVRPDSLITIEETSEDPSTKQRKVAWHVSSGEVNFQTVRKSGSTEISTPTVRSSVSEMASAAIRVAETGDSDIRLFQGTGKVETKAGQKVDLSPNESVKVDAGGKAGIKFSLPEVPTLVAPQHQSEISYPDPTKSTTLLLWKQVPGAVSYHVMLDYSPFFNRPLVDRKGIKGTSVEVRGLDVGKYYWRVAASSKDDVEGNFSDFARFTVAKSTGGAAASAGPAPPLTIEAMDVRSNILQITGRTEQGASVTVNGQRVDVQGDGSFNEFISLEPKAGPHTVVIRAIGLAGGVKEVKRQVTVSY